MLVEEETLQILSQPPLMATGLVAVEFFLELRAGEKKITFVLFCLFPS